MPQQQNQSEEADEYGTLDSSSSMEALHQPLALIRDA